MYLLAWQTKILGHFGLAECNSERSVTLSLTFFCETVNFHFLSSFCFQPFVKKLEFWGLFQSFFLTVKEKNITESQVTLMFDTLRKCWNWDPGKRKVPYWQVRNTAGLKAGWLLSLQAGFYFAGRLSVYRQEVNIPQAGCNLVCWQANRLQAGSNSVCKETNWLQQAVI